MTSRQPRDPSEYQRVLADQVERLRRAARAFDEGNLDVRRQEAPNLANGIALLVYNGKSARALLTQTGGLEQLSFECTVKPFDPNNHMPYSQLVRLGSDGQYHPTFVHGPLPNSRPRYLTFQQWWNEPVIVTTANTYGTREKYNRRKLTLDVRNTDGGAHWDSTLKVEYAQLTRGNALGWQMIDGDPPKSPPVAAGDPVPSCIRQIWFELEAALIGPGKVAGAQ